MNDARLDALLATLDPVGPNDIGDVANGPEARAARERIRASGPRRLRLARAGVGALGFGGLLALVVVLLVATPEDGARTSAPPRSPTFSIITRTDRPYEPPPAYAEGLSFLVPGSAQSAFTDATGTYFVGRNVSGKVCLVIIAGVKGPSISSCWGAAQLSGLSPMVITGGGKGAETRTFGLVPDGVSTVTTYDGRTSPVINNVFSVPGEMPAAITLDGPVGHWTVTLDVGEPAPEAAVAAWGRHSKAATTRHARSYEPEASPGALHFPPGTTYEQAIAAIFLTEAGGDPIDPAVTLVPRLPAGTVLLDPSDGSGITVDLAAPYGLAPTSGIAIPDAGVTWPPDYPGGVEALSAHIAQVKAAGGRWWAGGRIAATRLPACEVRTSRDVAPPPCGPRDVIAKGKTVGPVLS